MGWGTELTEFVLRDPLTLGAGTLGFHLILHIQNNSMIVHFGGRMGEAFKHGIIHPQAKAVQSRKKSFTVPKYFPTGLSWSYQSTRLNCTQRNHLHQERKCAKRGSVSISRAPKMQNPNTWVIAVFLPHFCYGTCQCKERQTPQRNWKTNSTVAQDGFPNSRSACILLEEVAGSLKETTKRKSKRWVSKQALVFGFPFSCLHVCFNCACLAGTIPISSFLNK